MISRRRLTRRLAGLDAPIGLEGIEQAAHHLLVAHDQPDLAPRIQFGLAQALAADKRFAPVAEDRAGVQPEAAQRPDVQMLALLAQRSDHPDIHTLFRAFVQGSHHLGVVNLGVVNEQLLLRPADRGEQLLAR